MKKMRDFDELVTVPAGSFLMGGDDGDSDARPQHEVRLPAFKIGKYPVTNAQYLRFVEATGRGWRVEGRRPEVANRPAVYVSWHDARAYCRWLTGAWRGEGRIAPGEVVRLPTEAEWEKAARGKDGRVYPWGDEWDEGKCNSRELELGDTTLVGIFPEGASPYGCLDMAGNVWEWTLSLWGKDWSEPRFKYPYDPADGRENEAGDDVLRVLRGGSFVDSKYFSRSAYRDRLAPDSRWGNLGVRVVV